MGKSKGRLQSSAKDGVRILEGELRWLGGFRSVSDEGPSKFYYLVANSA